MAVAKIINKIFKKRIHTNIKIIHKDLGVFIPEVQAWFHALNSINIMNNQIITQESP